MDIRKYLSEQIRKCRNRMNLARCIDCGVMFAAAGGVMGMVFELSSLAWPFYYVHLAAGLCFGGGFLAGEIYAVCSRVNMAQAARRLDSFGLKERMTTAYEWMDRGAETGEELADLQRQDAFSHYNRLRDRIRIPLCPHRRHVLALLLSAAVTVGLAFVPSPARDQALLRHQIGQQAEEELEQLEELVEALEGVDQEALSEEQRAGVQELLEAMRRSGEELARADTWESLGAAQERLDYKYREAGQSLARLAAQMEDPGAAGVASAQAMAQAAGRDGAREGLQASSSGPGSDPGGDGGAGEDNPGGREQGSGEGSDSQGTGEGAGTGGQGTGEGEGTSGQGTGEGAGTDGQGAGEGEGSGGQGAGEGAGSGGQGTGEGAGTGGAGGSGNGTGRGTGSSNTPHDYVSVPNAPGEDPSLTGNKDGDQNSDYFRQQNGLAWEGEHVDYNSVIGEYTDNAYEGIARGRYPSGMESVIRDYFENLNK